MTDKTSDVICNSIIIGMIVILVLFSFLMHSDIRRAAERNKSYYNCVKKCETCGKVIE